MKIKLLLLFGVLICALVPTPGLAKGLVGPVAIMDPEGDVYVLTGHTARVLVEDANTLGCNASCDSPNKAAELLELVVNRRHPRKYLVLFGADETPLPWTEALWFFPATRETPAYLVFPEGISDGRRAWSEWQEATPRMERLIEEQGNSSQLQSMLPTTGFDWGVVRMAGVLLVLGVFTLLLGLLPRKRKG